MRVYADWSEVRDVADSAVTIGNFDGVHRGHQALLERVRRHTADTGTAVVLTFEPHPVRVLAPELAPPLVCTRADKHRLLEREGVDVLLEQRFDREFAALSPRDFVDRVLARGLDARRVVVGYDFTFGRKRAGTTRTLAELGREFGFEVDVVPAREVGEGLVASSTKVREFVLAGRVEGAALVLGRPFHVNGTVVEGHRRGRDLGFPTANLDSPNELLPALGVYAGWLDWGQGARPAVVNIGFNPTFGDAPSRPSVEVHVLDAADLALYGRACRLFFRARLRDEHKFADLEALKRGIAADCEAARALLAEQPPPSGF